MADPTVTITLHVADIPQWRLFIEELREIAEDMPEPWRSRLEAAAARVIEAERKKAAETASSREARVLAEWATPCPDCGYVSSPK